MTKLSVVHDEAKRRFVGSFPNESPGESYVEYRFIRPDYVDFFRTVTEPELRGKGAAGEVVKRALLWAKEKRFQVKPSCSYVEAFVEKNAEFRELVSKL
jgi:predicted GNAT family acetyltransferase